LRSTLRWTCTVIACTTLFGGTLSCWHELRIERFGLFPITPPGAPQQPAALYYNETSQLRVACACLELYIAPQPGEKPLTRVWTTRLVPTVWWQFATGMMGTRYWVQIPLWPVVLLTAIPAFLMWRTDLRLWRRGRAGRCLTCGYDRLGLAADAACPECGKAQPDPSSKALPATFEKASCDPPPPH
jgi:hypothetical protein